MCCGRIYRAKFLKWGSVEYSVSIPTAPAPPTADTNCKNIPLNFCLEDALSANKNHHSFDHKYFALIYLISGGDGSISVGSTPSSIYSCSIGYILDHDFCHLGCWAVKEKFLKRRNFC